MQNWGTQTYTDKGKAGSFIVIGKNKDRKRVILEVAKGQADLEWDVRGESKADVTF